MAVQLCDPCNLDWGLAPDDLTCDGLELGSISATDKQEAVEGAVRLLYDKTCQRFRGRCTTTLRPFDVDRYCDVQPPTWPYHTRWSSNGWYMALDLGVDPIVALKKVTIGGVEEDLTLDPPGWRIDGGRWLVRQDGTLTWPEQDMSSPLSTPGTWSVTVEWGAPPPGLGKLAAGSLACQFLKARHGADCDLPDAVTSVTKRGVTLNFATMREIVETGMTGDALADQFINTYACKPQDGYGFVDPADPLVIEVGGVHP